jgi:CubicO group peptidase (beta-lactamase class C family)
LLNRRTCDVRTALKKEKRGFQMTLRGALVALLAPALVSCTLVQIQAKAGGRLGEQVDTVAKAEMLRGRVPGAAIAVLQNGSVLFMKAYGAANLELAVPVQTNSVFEIASLTKQFTAAAVLLLAHEGKLRLDDPLTGFVEQAPKSWEGITVRQLLTHTAGLEHRFEKSVEGTLLLDYSTDSMLASAKATPTFAAPGERFRYSDQGYFLLGLIIERVQSRTYAEFLSDRFFVPLGMTQTRIQDQARIVPNRVAGYTIKDELPVNIRRTWQFGLTSHFGVLSSVEDMAKWEQSLWTNQTLPLAVREQMWTPARIFRTNEHEGYLLAYGYGWWVISENGHRIIEHSGITGTHYFKDAKTGIAVVVLTNRDQPSGPGTVEMARKIAQLFDPTIPSAPK